MGVPISNFVSGGFIVTVEGKDNSYGLYEVMGADGAKWVELRDAANGSQFRCVLKVRDADEVTDKYPSSFAMHRGTLWGGSLSSGEPCEPTTLVDVIRVFQVGEREKAAEYFDALVAARKVLSKVRSGAAVAPLNMFASNPHAVELSNVEYVVETLQSRELAGLIGFDVECNNFLDEMNFDGDEEAVGAFLSKVAAEPPRSDFQHYLLTSNQVGVSPFGFFAEDIVRVQTEDGVQFLQVTGGDGVTVQARNIADGSACSLRIVSDLDESWQIYMGEYRYNSDIHVVEPDGSEKPVWSGSFMILPTRNPDLVGEFESIYKAQDVALKKFSDGIRARVKGFDETMRNKPEGFVVAISVLEQIELLNEISKLNWEAERCGDIARLQALKMQVRTLIEDKAESVRYAVYDLCADIAETLVQVAALNTAQPELATTIQARLCCSHTHA
jgi:hypothetical protein